MDRAALGGVVATTLTSVCLDPRVLKLTAVHADTAGQNLKSNRLTPYSLPILAGGLEIISGGKLGGKMAPVKASLSQLPLA
jgi:hypothetical protein